MSDTRALGTSRAPSFISFLNPLMRRLLGAGLPFGPNVVLTIRGRRSGLARTFPVAILEHDGRRYVQSPFGEVNWVRNLRAARQAVVSKGRAHEEVEAIEMTPDQAGAILEVTLSPYMRTRLGAAFVGRFFHLRPESTTEQFIAEARRHPMFELRAKAVSSGGAGERGMPSASERPPGEGHC
jgi:deazaflavin-dependent oxidoreductase (nitroreductase family)